MAMTEQEILTGLGEIIDEVAGVPADEVTPARPSSTTWTSTRCPWSRSPSRPQDKFGVEIPDDQLKDLKTVQDVVDYVVRAGVSA